jgi:type IV pilus assembly protein PilA
MTRSASKQINGFTLIELMIVVAIIGILAAIAIPAYQDYTAKAQASEGYALLDGLKAYTVEEMSQSVSCSISPSAVTTGKYVLSIVGTPGGSGANPNCTLVATFRTPGVNGAVAGQTITMVYTVGSAGVGGGWTCSSSLPTAIKAKAC